MKQNRREFWIWNFNFGPDENSSQECLVCLDEGGSEWIKNSIHVVELKEGE